LAWKAVTGGKVGAGYRSRATKVNNGPGRPALDGRWVQGKEVWEGALKVATWCQRRWTLGLEGRHWVKGGRRARKLGKRHRRWPHGE
jgi:hypothetical protein